MNDSKSESGVARYFLKDNNYVRRSKILLNSAEMMHSLERKVL